MADEKDIMNIPLDPTQVEDSATLVESEGTLIEEETQIESAETPEEGLGSAPEYAPGSTIGNGYSILSLLLSRTSSGQAQLYRVEKARKQFVAKVYFPGFVGADEKVRGIISQIDCPHLMKLREYGYLPDGCYYEVTDYFRQGSLEKHRGAAISKLLVPFIKELNEAIHVLHEHDLIHGDVKPQNIYLTDDGHHVVLGDYDITRFLDGRANIKNDRRMTPKYAAPECTNVPSIVMKESDMYSFGMTIRYISHAKDEYFDLLDAEAIAELRAMGELILPTDIDSDIRDLISMLTKSVAKERATYETVAAWLADPAPFRGNATAARFAENNPKINSFEYKGIYATTLYDLADAFDSDWSGLRSVLPAIKDNEFLLVKHLMDSGLQSTAVEIKALLTSHQPFYTKVFTLLHKLNPKIGFTAFGKRFGSLHAFFEYVYANPGFELMPAMVRYDVLRMQAQDEGNADLIAELEKLHTYFEKCNDEEWADVVLNYFRAEDRFYFHLKPRTLQEALAEIRQANPLPTYVTNRSRFLQAFFIKQGKLTQELGKSIFMESKGEADSRFFERFSYVLFGELEWNVAGRKATNAAQVITISNALFEKGTPAEIASLTKLFEDDGDFFFLLSLEKSSGDSEALQKLEREIRSYEAKLRPAVLYYATAAEPLYHGSKTMDDFASYALAQKDPEQAFHDAQADPIFKLWASRFVQLK